MRLNREGGMCVCVCVTFITAWIGVGGEKVSTTNDIGTTFVKF